MRWEGQSRGHPRCQVPGAGVAVAAEDTSREHGREAWWKTVFAVKEWDCCGCLYWRKESAVERADDEDRAGTGVGGDRQD